MQTILDILKRAGGWHPGLSLTIDNPPFMPLIIEAMDESGPCGLPAIPVAHYGKQNGDLMRDPEMCFELELRVRAGPQPFLLAQRLRRRGAMVEVQHRHAITPFTACSCYRAARFVRQGRGIATCVRSASPKPSSIGRYQHALNLFHYGGGAW